MVSRFGLEGLIRAQSDGANQEAKDVPEEFVQPMREELTRIGFQELRTAARGGRSY